MHSNRYNQEPNLTFFDWVFSRVFPALVTFTVIYIGGHVAFAIANGRL